MDSGAGPSTLRISTFRTLFGPDLPPLQPAPNPITNFDCSRIDGVLGVIPISVKLKDRVAADILHIVESPNAEVLGRNFLRPLGVFNLLRPLGIKQRKVRRRGLPKPSAPSRRINLIKGHFNVGDRVLDKLPHVPKCRPPYSGPVQIGEVLCYYTFRISDGRVPRTQCSQIETLRSGPSSSTNPVHTTTSWTRIWIQLFRTKFRDLKSGGAKEEISVNPQSDSRTSSSKGGSDWCIILVIRAGMSFFSSSLLPASRSLAFSL